MTHPPAPALTSVLDELDELRAKATPGLWAQQNGAPNLVYGDPDVGIFVCNTGYDQAAPEDSLPEADAALIVAAVNRLPQLTAALRAVRDLHAPHYWPDGDVDCTGCKAECQYCEGDHPWPCPTVAAITTALEAS